LSEDEILKKYRVIQKDLNIIIIIIIIINCNWVVTRWQWLYYMHTKYEIGYENSRQKEYNFQVPKLAKLPLTLNYIILLLNPINFSFIAKLQVEFI